MLSSKDAQSAGACKAGCAPTRKTFPTRGGMREAPGRHGKLPSGFPANTHSSSLLRTIASPSLSLLRRYDVDNGTTDLIATHVGAQGKQPAHFRAAQRKLIIGEPNAPNELEANRVADAVVRGEIASPIVPATEVNRTCEACSAPSREGVGRNEAPAIVHDVISTAGTPLAPTQQSTIEGQFARDFSAVRIHNDDRAAQSAAAVNAQAYTVGNHIVFGAGRFDPQSSASQHLLAHELAHVAQQGETPARLMRQAVPLAEPEIETRPEPEAEPFDLNLDPEVGNDNALAEAKNDNTLEVSSPIGQLRTVHTPYHDRGSRTNWPGAARYVGAQREQAALIAHLESQPKAVLDRGGVPPNYVSRAIGRQETYIVTREDEALWPTQARQQITFVPTEFHVLDAIEHDMAIAQNPAQVKAVFEAFTRERTTRATALDFNFFNTPPLPSGASVTQFYNYIPWEPDTREERRETLSIAAAKQLRVLRQRGIDQALDAAEQFALKGRQRQPGPCSFKVRPGHPSGNMYQERHNAFADHVALISGYGSMSAEAVVTTPEGITTSFDTFDPKSKSIVWEVKTRHEWASPSGMAAAPYRLKNFLERIYDLEGQRLTGLYVARRCGLDFRYAVDNCSAAQGLRQQWTIPPVYYIPYPGETKVAC